MNSTQKIALVTGAGSGIGRRTALALLEAGYSVALAGRRVEALEETVQHAGTADSKTLVAPTDVRDQASVQATFAKIKKTFGRLDLLFNNAGIGVRGVNLEDLTYEQWRSVVDTNLTGTFLCVKHAVAKYMMKAKAGRIINLGSVAGMVGKDRRVYEGTQMGGFTMD